MKKYMIILLVSLLLSSCAQPQGELSMPAKEDSTLQDSAGDVIRESIPAADGSLPLPEAEVRPQQSQEDRPEAQSTAEPESVWQIKDTQETDAPGDFPVDFCTAADGIYVLYYHQDEENHPHYFITVLAPDGSLSSSEYRGIAAGAGVVSFAAGGGYSWLLVSQPVLSEEKAQYLLYCLKDGEVVSETNLAGRVSGSLTASAKGSVWLSDYISGEVRSYAADGTLVQTLGMPQEGLDMIAEGKDSCLYGFFRNRDESGTSVFTPGQGGFDREAAWSGSNPDAVYPGMQGLFMFTSGDALYEYYPESGSEKHLVTFSEEGISSQLIYGVLCGEDDRLYILWQGSSLDRIRISILEKSMNAYLDSFLTMAALTFTDEMRELVTLYNRSGRPYKIVLKEYAGQTGESADPADARNRLNADLIGGDEIDILDLSGIEDSRIRRQYAELGLLENLYPWMERDSGFHPEDYQLQVWRANEVDGGLYNLVPFYGIDTVFGRTSVYGDTWQITPEAVFRTEEPLMVYGRDCTADDILRAWCGYVMDGTGESLQSQAENTERLMKLFTFAAAYPDTPTGGESIRDMHAGRQLMEAAGGSQGMGIARDLERYMASKALMGEDVSFTGHPVDTGTGSAFQNVISAGMCAASKKKEGVWDFFRFMLEETVQNNTEDFLLLKKAIPVRLSAWEASCRAAMALEQGNGAGIFREGEEWFVLFPVITQEEVDKVNQLIAQITRVREYDYALYDLLKEEFTNFRNGTKTLEESVAGFSGRARNYLDESE